MRTQDVGTWFKGDTLSELVVPVKRLNPDGTKAPYPLDGASATLQLRSKNRPDVQLEVEATIDGDGSTAIVRLVNLAKDWVPPMSPAGVQGLSPVAEKFLGYVKIARGSDRGIGYPVLDLELVSLP